MVVQVFGNRDLILITPNGETAATIHIDIGPGGTLVVTSLNAYKINYMGDANIEALFNVDAQLVERLHCCTTGGGASQSSLRVLLPMLSRCLLPACNTIKLTRECFSSAPTRVRSLGDLALVLFFTFRDVHSAAGHKVPHSAG